MHTNLEHILETSNLKIKKKIQPKLTKYIIIFVFMVFLNVFFVNQVFATSHNTEDPSLPLVSLQLQLRNSEGQLVAYIEPTVMYITNLKGVHDFLDTKDSSSIVYNGKLHELIEYKQKFYFTEEYHGQMASFDMFSKGESVLAYRHDGYIAQPGDTLDVSWKIIRTI